MRGSYGSGGHVLEVLLACPICRGLIPELVECTILHVGGKWPEEFVAFLIEVAVDGDLESINASTIDRN